MRNFKKVLAVGVGAVMLASTVTATAAEFSDTEGHWAEATIEKWADKGLVSGYPNGTFLPDNPVTRVEFAKIMTVAFDLTDTGETEEYPDVTEEDWYWEYVNCAGKYIPVYSLPVEYETNMPYVENRESGYNGFLPDTPALRAHAAEALSLVMIEQNDIEITVPEKISGVQADLLETFNDADFEELFGGMHGVPTNVSRMFEYSWLANELGIMQGDENGYFNPYGQITRAELVTMVDRIIGDEE